MLALCIDHNELKPQQNETGVKQWWIYSAITISVRVYEDSNLVLEVKEYWCLCDSGSHLKGL